MIILKEKDFGFLDNLTGNKKLYEAIRSNFNKPKSIAGWIKNTFNSLPQDLLSYLSVLDENDVNKSICMTNGNGTRLILVGLEDIENQAEGKSLFSYQKSEESRIILMATNLQGNNEYVLSWYPSSKTYTVTKESLKYCIISRTVNWIFGDHGIQVVQNYKTLKDAFSLLDSLRTHVVYCSETEKQKIFHYGEETKKTKKKFRVADDAISGTIGAIGGAAIGHVLGGKKGAVIGGTLGAAYGVRNSEKRHKNDNKTSGKKVEKPEELQAGNLGKAIGAGVTAYGLGSAGEYIGKSISRKRLAKDIGKRLGNIENLAKKGDKKAQEFIAKYNSDPENANRLIAAAAKNSERIKTAGKIGLGVGLTAAAGVTAYDHYKRKKLRKAYKEDKEKE